MKSHWSLVLLRIAAVLAALIALYQLFTGFGWAGPWPLHPRMGEATTTFAAIGAIAAFIWSRQSGNQGLLWHALGMTLFGVLQIVLGHMHLTLVHQIFGVIYLIGIIALATLAFRKPGAARTVDAPVGAPVDHR
ncbi:hypothetical protein PCC79_16380 [Propioniciclava soli]|uniref:Uncharacterized protein n=1 Tax=Propioniciclava soli TaxID=2775081 RepID=A0ABZ3C8C0_9ACTN